MPELPEVETTRRGLEPYLVDQIVTEVVIRNHRLRWPVDPDLVRYLNNQKILNIGRRGKYLQLYFSTGVVLIHLGMSGSLRVLPTTSPAKKHDHIDLILNSGNLLRFRDPRRFGSFIWSQHPCEFHPLLVGLGPEPLTSTFDKTCLIESCRGRKRAIKTHLMDSHVVVGVGNIYANEALFQAGIRPTRRCSKVSQKKLSQLVTIIKKVLLEAIEQGGTTLKDFANVDGLPGYFSQKLRVYGRKGEFCYQCHSVIKQIKQGQRSSFYCPTCQK